MWQPRSADELRNLTALAQAAVGFDSTRGDVLTVEDLAFDGNRPRTAGRRFRSSVLNAAENSPVLVKYLALLLLGLLVVVAFGVRPALRHAAARWQRLRPAKDGRENWRRQQRLRRGAANSGAGGNRSGAACGSQEIFEQVTTHLKREPTQSSRLLQSWIHSD